MIRYLYAISIFSLFVVFLGGCGNVNVLKSAEEKIVFPEVVTVTPADRAQNVTSKPNIIVKFSVDMDKGSLDTNILLRRGGSSLEVPLLITANGSEASCFPEEYLTPDTIYILTVKQGAKSISGFPTLEDYSIHFTTSINDTKPPTIEVISPTCIEPYGTYSVYQSIVLFFSEEMDRNSVESAFTFICKNTNKPIGGNVKWEGANFIWNPAEELIPMEVYVLTLTSNASDSSGNRMEENYSASYKISGGYESVDTIGETSDYYFMYPTDMSTITIDGKDYIYVSDYLKRSIVRYRLNPVPGIPEKNWRYQFDENSYMRPDFTPTAVSVNTKGEVYAYDSYSEKLLFIVDKEVVGEKQLDLGALVYNIKIWEDNSSDYDLIYISDKEEDAIHFYYRFHTSTVIHYYTSWGGGLGEFGELNDIALDASGDVYAVDRTNKMIQKFDWEGNFIMEWGGENSQLKNPVYIDIDENDIVYIFDTGDTTIKKYDLNGNFLEKFDYSSLPTDYSIEFPTSINVDRYENILISDQTLGKILRLGKDFSLSQWMGSPSVNEEHLEHPSDMAMFSNGNLLVGDFPDFLKIYDKEGFNDYNYDMDFTINKFTISPNDVLFIFSSDYQDITAYVGFEIEYLTEWGGPGTDINSINDVQTICSDKNDNVYIVDIMENYLGEKSSYFKVFDKNGGFISGWKISTLDENIEYYHLVYNEVTESVFLLFTKNKSLDGWIKEINSQGVVINGDVKSGIIPFSSDFYPTNIALDKTGNLIISDYITGYLKKYTYEGEFIEDMFKLFFELSFSHKILVNDSNSIYLKPSMDSSIRVYGLALY